MGTTRNPGGQDTPPDSPFSHIAGRDHGKIF